jgi:hypothetical protein
MFYVDSFLKLLVSAERSKIYSTAGIRCCNDGGGSLSVMCVVELGWTKGILSSHLAFGFWSRSGSRKTRCGNYLDS